MAHSITEQCQGCMLCTRACPVKAIHGEKRQLHIIEAHLCIDCGTCGRVCPFAAVQDDQGQIVTQVQKNKWLKPLWNTARCVCCNICVAACPVGVIDLLPPQKRIAYPYLRDELGCIGCSFCAHACPTDAITMHQP